MNRRHLLLSATASAVAAMLPFQAMALAPAYVPHNVPVETIDMLYRIEEAIEITGMYARMLHERASLLGICPEACGDVASLRRVAHELVFDFGSVDIRDRIAYLIAIKQKLDEHVGIGAADHRKLLNNHEPIFRYSAMEMLHTGNLTDLRGVALSLGADIA